MLIRTQIEIAHGMSGVSVIEAIKAEYPNITIPMSVNKAIFHLAQYILPQIPAILRDGLDGNIWPEYPRVWVEFTVGLMFKSCKYYIAERFTVNLVTMAGVGYDSKGKKFDYVWKDRKNDMLDHHKFALACIKGNPPSWTFPFGMVANISSNGETVRFLNGVSITIPPGCYPQ